MRVGACSVSAAHYGMPGSPPPADHQSWPATRRAEGHDVSFCFPGAVLVTTVCARVATLFGSVLNSTRLLCHVVIRIICSHKVN